MIQMQCGCGCVLVCLFVVFNFPCGKLDFILACVRPRLLSAQNKHNPNGISNADGYGHKIINRIAEMREKNYNQTDLWTDTALLKYTHSKYLFLFLSPFRIRCRSSWLARIISIFQRKILLCFQKNNIYITKTWKSFLREPSAAEKKNNKSALHSKSVARVRFIVKFKFHITLKQFYRLFGVAGIHLMPNANTTTI